MGDKPIGTRPPRKAHRLARNVREGMEILDEFGEWRVVVTATHDTKSVPATSTFTFDDGVEESCGPEDRVWSRGRVAEPAVAIREFAEQWDEAARRANAAYLDGLSMWGGLRRLQEFDQLTDAGKAVWRVVVRKAIEHAPEQLIRDVRGGS